jgi:hypothetical protein
MNLKNVMTNQELKSEAEKQIQLKYQNISRVIMCMIAVGYYLALVMFITYPMFSSIPHMMPTPYQTFGTKFYRENFIILSNF